MADITEAPLDSLRDQGAERFDAAGWHYLHTLAQRAAAHEGTVRRLLDAKLEGAVAAFAQRFAEARTGAAELLAAATDQYPQSAGELQQLFAESDFGGLRRLHSTLEAQAQCAVLAGLVAQLDPVRAAPSPAVVSAPALELKTVRESRATWARLSVDRQLSQAMKLAPQNAGPINSHMLILRSLAMMQDISPEYLSLMVSYADTLLALDPGVQEIPAKKKKPASPKTAKAGKASKKTVG